MIIKEAEFNKLKSEKSPYLLQHAKNPVHWYPWGEEAFTKARDEDKPIFLSIGYSTCHWCHVMAHESFEDNGVAELMNEVFVSIKVDREERPDIDKIYMTVCQMMTGSGGWPLTIIMTPDKKPFFAGTYFSKETRFGRIGLLDLIKRIKELWKNQRNEILNSAEQIAFSLQNIDQESPGEKFSDSTLKKAYRQLSIQYDSVNGGFSTRPKFPTPHNLIFLLRYWKRTGDNKALEMVEKTLLEMRKGGIYDHIGFGFHRYSTDTLWLVPHFEKMLYDQALIAIAYIEAYQATKNDLYRKTAEEIFTYVLRDMTSP
ncbi:MAG: thioredoxin domain-containing protein, partial [Candidatus Hodarchaeota archaeon]